MPRKVPKKSSGGLKLDMGGLYPKQWEFMESKTRYTAYGGARGGGKTHVLIRKSLRGALEHSGIKILILRRTYPELEATIIQPLIKLVNSATMSGRPCGDQLATYNGTMRLMSFVRAVQGSTGLMDMVGSTAGQVGKALSGQDPGGLAQMNAAGVEGMKVAAMAGGAQELANHAIVGGIDRVNAAPDLAIDNAYGTMREYGPFSPQARSANQRAVEMLPGAFGPQRQMGSILPLTGGNNDLQSGGGQGTIGAESPSMLESKAVEGQPETLKVVEVQSQQKSDFNPPAMTESEETSILSYKGGHDAYVINEALYTRQPLSAQHIQMVQNLDSALSKAPVYKGRTYRNISFDLQGEQVYRAFLAQYEVGTIVSSPAFTSSSKTEDGHITSGPLSVHFVIDGTAGADLSGYGLVSEQEVIHQRGINFEVLSIGKNADEEAVIHMVEVMDHGETGTGQMGTTLSGIRDTVQRVQKTESGGTDMPRVSGWDTERDHKLGSGARESDPLGAPEALREAGAEGDTEGRQAPSGGGVDGRGPSVGAAQTGFTGDTVRGFSENMATDQGMRQDIREDFRLDPEMYPRLGNSETLAKAQSIFDQGLDKAETQLEQAIGAAKAGHKLPPEMVVLSRLVANELSRNGDLTKARDILSDVSVELTEAGQTAQAANILRSADPLTKSAVIQKMVDRINRKLEDRKNHRPIQVEQSLVDRYAQAATDVERDAVLDQIHQSIADQIPSTLIDKFTALRYLNMLGNLKTQVRNVSGNIAMQPARMVKDKIAAGIEAVVDKFSDGKLERTKSFVYDPALYRAAAQDFAAVRHAAMGEQKYAMTGASDSLAIDQKRAIFKNNGTWGTLPESAPGAKAARKITDIMWMPLEGARRLTNQAMETGDVWFSKFTCADALAGFLTARGVTVEQWNSGRVDAELMDEARAYAIREAQKATYRDNNQFSDMIASMGYRHPKTDAEKVANAALQGTLPFRRTPANVLVRAVEYSPLVFFETGIKAARRKLGKNDLTGADIIDSLASNLTGVGIFALGMSLFAQGFLSGGPDDDEEQAEFDDLNGKQNYALTLPDGTSFTLDWLTPVSIPLFMGAEYAKNGLENGYTLGSLMKAAASITDPMLEMSMLQGVNDQLSNISFSEYPMVDLGLNSLLGYMTQGLTSTLGGQIERTSEDRRMSTFTDKNGTLPTGQQYALGRASAKVPGWDYQQIPYIDAWGRTESTGNLPMRALQNFVLPGYLGRENRTEADQELQRLYDATGEAGVLPGRADKFLTVRAEDGPGKKLDLNSEQYVEFATERGQVAYDMVSELISSDAYQQMSDSEKAHAIGLAYTYAQQMAGKQVAPEYALDKWVDLAQTAQRELGLSESEYLALYSSYGAGLVNGDGIRDAYRGGVEPEQYISYRENLTEVKGDKSSTSQVDAAKALARTPGLTNEERAALWQDQGSNWKEEHNPFGERYTEVRNQFKLDMNTFLQALDIYNGPGKKYDKMAAMRELLGGSIGNRLYYALGK